MMSAAQLLVRGVRRPAPDSRFVASLSLLVVAAVAVTPVAFADLRVEEHPTHSVVLGLVVAVVVAIQRRLGSTAATTLHAVAVALTAQPVLHFISKAKSAAPDRHDGHETPLHILRSEVPVSVVQILVPALVLAGLIIVMHQLGLLVNEVRGPLETWPLLVPCPCSDVAPPRPRRLGSMVSSCGWVIKDARRGPPVVAHGLA